MTIPLLLLPAAVLAAAGWFCISFLRRRDGAAARLRAFAHKNGALWLFAFGVTALFFAFTLCVTVMSYMTNDDVFFMEAAARVPELGFGAVVNSIANSAQEGTESMSVFLAAFIGLFYNIDAEFPWYLGYHLVILFASLTVVGRCVLLKTRRRGWPLWAGCLIHAALCLGVFMYTLAVIAFTVTAAVAGTAAVALMLCRDDGETAAGRAASDIGSGVLMLLCVMQRLATGKCLLCFWALAVAYQLVRIILRREDARRKKRALALAAGALATLAVIFAANAVSVRQSDPEYHRAEYYRSLVMDYLNDEITYEQYAQVGVPQELATLLHGWYFMDERVTTDMFQKVSELYYAEQAAAPQTPLPARLISLAASLVQTIRDDEQMLSRVGCALALLLACAAAFVRFGRRYLLEFLTALCAAGGALILSLTMISGGRFLLRVFLVVMLPAITMLLLLALTAPPEAPPVKRGRRTLSVALASLTAAAFLVFCGMGVYHVPCLTQEADRETLFADQWTVEAYADAHPDILYPTNLYDTNLDPLHSPRYPQNIRLWGAVGDTYRTEGRLYGKDFFRDDVRFLCHNPGYIMFLLQYLTLDNGPVAALDEIRLTQDTCVYELMQIAPDGDYTGWYEWNGLRYYFQDGQAVTGARVIDGAAYEFAPAGADAPMTVITTDRGTYYTTTAYSLLEG